MARFVWLLSLAGCAAATEPSPSKAPLGQLPAHVTSAEPEWLPKRISVGRPAPLLPEESALRFSRRLGSERDLVDLVWEPGGEALWVLREDEGQGRSVWRWDLTTGSLTSLSKPGEVVSRLFGGGDEVGYETEDARVLLRPSSESRPRGRGDLVAALGGVDGDLRIAEVAESRRLLRGDTLLLSAPEIGALAPIGLAGNDAIFFGTSRCDSSPCGLVAERIERVSSSGRGRTVVVEAAPYTIAAMTVHPESGALVFECDRDRKDGDLYEVSAQGGEVTRVTLGQATRPRLSPDGTKLAFLSSRFGAVDAIIAGWRSAR